MPLSSGPTLFFAPSPIEWQGRHLLKDVLPAAASCASAADASADEAITTSALNVSFFMDQALWVTRRVYPQVLAWPQATHKRRCGAGNQYNLRWLLRREIRCRSAAYPNRLRCD